jgi:hypothetical protein
VSYAKARPAYKGSISPLEYQISKFNKETKHYVCIYTSNGFDRKEKTILMKKITNCFDNIKIINAILKQIVYSFDTYNN